MLPLVLLLAGLRENFGRKLADLSNIVISEKIDRFTKRGDREGKLDSFDAVVEVVDGLEQYSEVASGRRVYDNIGQIRGLWSYGEIARLIQTTRDALQDKPWVREGTEVHFHVAADARRWFVMVDSTVCWLDFDIAITFSPDTNDIARIAWLSDPMPAQTGLARVIWSVDFRPTDVAGQQFTLPSEAVYRIIRCDRAASSDWNITTFRRYTRYGSQVRLTYAR